MHYKKFYVIVWHKTGKDYYFQYEKQGELNPKTLEVLSEAEGIFTENIDDAKKFKEFFTAQFIASAYPQCEVGEVMVADVVGGVKSGSQERKNK